MDIGHLRTEYAEKGLRRRDLYADPVTQFAAWFEDACRAQILEPNAMILATAGRSGMPTQRTVLLKAFDDRGFVFFTNLDSRKAKQIAENSNVSLLFPWIALTRQVAITGEAQKIAVSEAMKYFATRPVESQLAAWASPQSEVISSRNFLQTKWREMKKKFTAGQIPFPSFWGGYRVYPHTIEFWQGGRHRLHDRFLYTRGEDGTWSLDRLGP